MANTCNRVEPTKAVKPNKVSVGISASMGAHRRNAAQSARNTAKQIASAATSMKPGRAVVGATTCWKACHDDCRDAGPW